MESKILLVKEEAPTLIFQGHFGENGDLQGDDAFFAEAEKHMTRLFGNKLVKITMEVQPT